MLRPRQHRWRTPGRERNAPHDPGLRYRRTPWRVRRRSRHQRASRPDLSNDVVPIRLGRARQQVIRVGRVRQHLHAHQQPDDRRARAARRRPRGRRRRAGSRERAGRGHVLDLKPGARRRSHRQLGLAIRRHLQRVFPHPSALRHRRRVGRPRTIRAAVDDAIGPNTKAVFAETIGNPKIDVLDIERSRRESRTRRRAADRRQHAGHTVSCCGRSSTAPTSSFIRRRSSSADTARRSAA